MVPGYEMLPGRMELRRTRLWPSRTRSRGGRGHRNTFPRTFPFLPGCRPLETGVGQVMECNRGSQVEKGPAPCMQVVLDVGLVGLQSVGRTVEGHVVDPREVDFHHLPHGTPFVEPFPGTAFRTEG